MTSLFEVAFCKNWVDWFLLLAWWMLIAGLVLGVGYVVVDLLSKWNARKAIANRTGAEAAEILPALGGLIEALTKAPSWFALFAAGLGLIWVASSQIPDMCRQKVTTPTENRSTTSNSNKKASEPEVSNVPSS